MFITETSLDIFTKTLKRLFSLDLYLFKLKNGAKMTRRKKENLSSIVKAYCSLFVSSLHSLLHPLLSYASRCNTDTK